MLLLVDGNKQKKHCKLLPATTLFSIRALVFLRVCQQDSSAPRLRVFFCTFCLATSERRPPDFPLIDYSKFMNMNTTARKQRAENLISGAFSRDVCRRRTLMNGLVALAARRIVHYGHQGRRHSHESTPSAPLDGLDS